MIASAAASRSSFPTASTYVPSRFEDDAQDQAADDGTDGALDPAQNRGRKRIDDDALHHIGIEEDHRRDHDPGDRADHRGQSPAEREHPAHANPEHAALFGIDCRRAHREPELRFLEEKRHQAERNERDDDDPNVLRAEGHAAELQRRGRKRRWKRLHDIAPNPAGQTVDRREQPQRHDDDRQLRRALDRPNDQPLQRDAADERHDDRDEKRGQHRYAHLHELPRDVR